MVKNRQPQPEKEEEEEHPHPQPKTQKLPPSHSRSDPDDSDSEEHAPVLNIKSTTFKRPAEKESESEGKETKAKKLKKRAEAEVKMPSSSSSAEKRHFFQRLWSEEDEIVILSGMTDYVVKENVYLVANIGAFLNFIKKSLHVVDVTESQLKDKISKLKKKYEKNAIKQRTWFPKSHEQRVYDLSKRIWGDENDGGVAGYGEASVGWRLDYSGLHEWIMNVGANKVEADKRLEMEGKWRKFEQQEVELCLNKLELMCEQTRFVLEDMKKGR